MGTHTIDWREVGTMASIRADLWIYPLKLWGFFPKEDCKKIRLELLRPGSANQELSIFSQLANEPIFTPNISKPHLCLGLVPKEMSSGLAGWQEHAVLSIITSQWSIGLREKKSQNHPRSRGLQGSERCQNHTPPCQAGFASELPVLSNQDGKVAQNQRARFWRCHGTKGYVVVKNPLRWTLPLVIRK